MKLFEKFKIEDCVDFMMGIYCFRDLENDGEIVYVGKDSNLKKNKRYYAHIAPSKYDAQPINRIVQNNPNRYKYEVLKKLEKNDEYPPNLLSALEIIYIRRHRPKFNYTIGGDGGNFGKYHREWKDYARIVKKNIDNDKQKYCIKFEGEVIKQSFYPQKLIDWFEDEYPDEILVYDDELKDIEIEDYSGANNPNWKDYGRIIKLGIEHNKRVYAVRFNGENLKQSVDFDYLIMWFKIHYPDEELRYDDEKIICNFKINKDAFTLYTPPDYAKIVKYGIVKETNKQTYGISFNGEIIKTSIHPQKLIDWFKKEYPEEIILCSFESDPNYQETYPRITKYGYKNGKQNYAIYIDGKYLKQSIFPQKLIDWFEDEYPDEKLVYDEELISEKSKLYEEEAHKNRSESHKGEKSHLWGTSIIEKFGGMDFLKSRAKEGKTQEEVAAEIGKDRMVIRSYLKTRGTSWGELKENKSIDSIIDDWGGVDYMKDEIKKGRSMEDVANDIGLSSQSLRKYLKKRGTSWTELTKNVPIVRSGSIVDEYGGIPFIKQCILEGKSQQEIANKIGRDRTLIQKYLKSRGTSWKELKKET